MDPDAIQRQINAINDQIALQQSEEARTTERHEFAINDATKRADEARAYSDSNPSEANAAEDFDAKVQQEQSEMERDKQSFEDKIRELESEKAKLESELKNAYDEQEKKEKLQRAADIAQGLSRDR